MLARLASRLRISRSLRWILGASAVPGGESGVDVGEKLGQLACPGPGGHDALLVVPELRPGQVEVAVGLVLVDLGQELGRGAAGMGSVPLCRGHGDVLEVQFRR